MSAASVQFCRSVDHHFKQYILFISGQTTNSPSFSIPYNCSNSANFKPDHIFPKEISILYFSIPHLNCILLYFMLGWAETHSRYTQHFPKLFSQNLASNSYLLFDSKVEIFELLHFRIFFSSLCKSSSISKPTLLWQ